MKHKLKSASPCHLERQRLRDRLHRQAKPNKNHDGTILYFSSVGDVRRLISLPSPGGEGLLSRRSPIQIPNPKSAIRNASRPSSQRRNVALSQRPSFPSQVPDFTLFLSFSPRSIAHQLSNLGTSEPSNVQPSTGTYPARSLARNLARSGAHNGTQKSLQNTLWHTKTRSFFKIIFSSAQPRLRIKKLKPKIENDHFMPVSRRLLEIIGFQNSAETTAEISLEFAETS